MILKNNLGKLKIKDNVTNCSISTVEVSSDNIQMKFRLDKEW